MELKIRIVFDRKGCQVDMDEQAIEAIVADFRDQLEAMPVGEPPALAESVWHRTAQAAGTLTANLGGFLLLAVLLGGMAAAARIGWSLAG